MPLSTTNLVGKQIRMPDGNLGTVLRVARKWCYVMDETNGRIRKFEITGTAFNRVVPDLRRHTPVLPATEADEQELVKRYGKTSSELADEAEKGYDVSKIRRRN
jgi:methyl coenzyme M reductase subunit C-like uncharacterized protein (methanogenesis marker protein 7)